jgi:hypothetical protein
MIIVADVRPTLPRVFSCPEREPMSSYAEFNAQEQNRCEDQYTHVFWAA